MLQNPVPVEALYDRSAAHEVALNKLLQREGYRDLDAVRAEGLERCLEQTLAHPCERRIGRALSDDERASLRARLAACGSQRLGDVVLDLDGPALLAWLVDPAAR